MRIIARRIRAAAVLVFAFLAVVSVSPAQQTEVMMPAQSAAKAKEILQQAIEGLGGAAYLSVHDVTCSGRAGQFGHSGELGSFGHFEDYTIPIPPFRDRTENIPKRNIIEVRNGDKGWDLDRGGVSEARTSELAQYQEDMKTDIDNILRHRIHESDMIFRYGGSDVVDLHESEWVELVDSDNRTIRIAIANSSHLPIRMVIDTRNANTRMRTEEIEYFSNYHPLSGIQTPFQITRDRNGIKVFQVFLDKCEYNTNLSDSLFTKESLDERWDKVGKKPKDKKSKDAAASDTDK
ncbi:MAG: hypothetical protein ABSF68_01975 [Candidatus Acidiferrales bacterium]